MSVMFPLGDSFFFSFFGYFAVVGWDFAEHMGLLYLCNFPTNSIQYTFYSSHFTRGEDCSSIRLSFV